MYLETGFDNYVMNPQVRVNLQPKSSSVEFIKSDSSQPVRVVWLLGEIYSLDILRSSE